MAFRTLLFGCFLLLGSGLSACQRASYSFQRAPTAVDKPAAFASVGAAPQAAGIAPPLARLPPARHRQALPTTGQLATKPLLPALKWALRLAPIQHQPPAAAVLVPYATQPDAGPPPPELPVRLRTRGIAFLLALLIPYGFYNFYLGYKERGILSLGLLLAGLYLVLIGGVVGGMNGYLISSLVIVIGLALWQLVSAIRILTKDLKPKDGEYYPGLFQRHG